MIVGIDEVGRGAWAGPLVVGAVILGGESIPGLTDSKLLTPKRRVELDSMIRDRAKSVVLGWVDARCIDDIGLSAALKLAARRALAQIPCPYDEIIIDGTIRLVDDPRAKTMKKADLLIPSVSAASIVAKVARDAYMERLDETLPGYGFGRHVGYGTALHAKAISEQGPTHEHRYSFGPLAPYRQHGDTPRSVSQSVPTAIGARAEAVVERYLTARGHTIVARNWKTKVCEIDVVSLYGQTYYFTEVKYRKNSQQGGGLAAITSKKYQQMAFAAEYFICAHSLSAYDRILAVADVHDDPPDIRQYLELSEP